jgi:hypothetical protein
LKFWVIIESSNNCLPCEKLEAMLPRLRERFTNTRFDLNKITGPGFRPLTTIYYEENKRWYEYGRRFGYLEPEKYEEFLKGYLE